MKPITYRPAARKALRRMPVNTAQRIMGKIEAYAADPAAQAQNVKALHGRDGIRLRVGDWRVIMIDGEVLDVLEVGPCGSIDGQEAAMNEMVTIPRAEYERLLEAAEALADVQAFDRAVAAGGGGMPHAILARIIAGEQPVRVIREWRGITAAELARRAGLHRVQVHDIETGKTGGSVSTLKRIADALDVPLDDIVA
ncbi:MAG TPA: helix-turn-helix domain-containing protein [Amaricoccus sp.]|nr:helix-turn-helix domain-containing protein [Amaricoccus sp.]